MNKEKIVERVAALRALMKEKNIDAYIIPSSDYHLSEYTGDYFKEREFMSGFAGSAGTLLITKADAILWTDGRYFLQAEMDVKDTPFVLYKQGLPGVLSLEEYLKLHDELVNIAFDGRTLRANYVSNLKQSLGSKVNLIYNVDLVNEIWEERPSLPLDKAYLQDVKYAGVTSQEKLDAIKAWMKKKGANAYILTSLDDIAYTLNLRGNDVLFNPVVLSYLLIYRDQIIYYINKDKLTLKVKKYLHELGIKIKDYFAIYKDVKHITRFDTVLLNSSKVNYTLYASLKTNKIIKSMDYSTEAKAVKNETEIKGAYACHERDGASLTKFIYWVKKNVGKIPMTEISVSDYLEALRSKNDLFKGLSFGTIAGFREHGAIIHYEATPETDVPLEAESFLLVDSGAQYLDGTTDVTRTIALGKLSEEEIHHYTLVLKSHIDLRNTIFLKGTTGISLDMISREPLWKEQLNYLHGTGHGVGSFLNVHEGPQSVSSHYLNNYPFKAGMVTSNEPGLYFENKYGIRIENLTLTVEKGKSEWGEFLGFDDLTLAPYEVEAIDKSMLTVEETAAIHAYHERCYQTLSPYLTNEEKEWLKGVCDAI